MIQPFEQARAIFRRVFATAIVSWSFIFYFSCQYGRSIVTRFLTRPLLALTDGAKRLATGERGATIKSKTLER